MPQRGNWVSPPLGADPVFSLVPHQAPLGYPAYFSMYASASLRVLKFHDFPPTTCAVYRRPRSNCSISPTSWSPRKTGKTVNFCGRAIVQGAYGDKVFCLAKCNGHWYCNRGRALRRRRFILFFCGRISCRSTKLRGAGADPAVFVHKPCLQKICCHIGSQWFRLRLDSAIAGRGL